MLDFWNRFKKRWDISSDRQVVIILIVFTLTGTTTMVVHYIFNRWVGIGKESSFWLKLLTFIVLALPLYNVLLIIYGALFGQFKFFKSFIIKFFKSLVSWF